MTMMMMMTMIMTPMMMTMKMTMTMTMTTLTVVGGLLRWCSGLAWVVVWCKSSLWDQVEALQAVALLVFVGGGWFRLPP